MNTTKTLATAMALTAFLTGCPKDNTDANTSPMTVGEASQALSESTADSQAATLTQNTIEISTNFTIGKAVTDAAGELKTFIATQLPCADIELAAPATLTVTYGAHPGNCTYNGHTFSGEHEITLSKNDTGDVEVDHKWTAISNGIVRVTGTAHVTWSLANESRHVTYDLDWTRVSDNLTGDANGDVTQTALPEGVATGIQIDGTRSWTGAAGKWDLTVSGVQVRWVDPVPQAGSYRLATPNNRSLSLSFARVDTTTIAVTLSNGTKSFSFDVNETGSATQK